MSYGALSGQGSASRSSGTTYLSKNPRNIIESLETKITRLETENQQLRRFGHFANTAKVFGEGFRTVRMVGPWFFAWLIVRDMGDTVTELSERIFGPASLVSLLSLLGIGGLIYGKRQAKLRRDDVARLGRYKELYERHYDPQRSSSAITKRGETRPEDE